MLAILAECEAGVERLLGSDQGAVVGEVADLAGLGVEFVDPLMALGGLGAMTKGGKAAAMFQGTLNEARMAAKVARTARASKQTIYRWWKSPACLAVDAALAKLAAPKPAEGRPERIVSGCTKLSYNTPSTM